MKKIIYFLLVMTICMACEPIAIEETDSSKYVDLGLSVKWATCNVGNTRYGWTLAWGDWTPYKGEYTPQNYSYSALKYEDGRIPTPEEWEELQTQCTWVWGRWCGVVGYKVIGPNWNYIVLPAAGFDYYTTQYSSGEVCCYWADRTHESHESGEFAYVLWAEQGYISSHARQPKFVGCSVRLVK